MERRHWKGREASNQFIYPFLPLFIGESERREGLEAGRTSSNLLGYGRGRDGEKAREGMQASKQFIYLFVPLFIKSAADRESGRREGLEAGRTSSNLLGYGRGRDGSKGREGKGRLDAIATFSKGEGWP
jgi:hypothetical protein